MCRPLALFLTKEYIIATTLKGSKSCSNMQLSDKPLQQSPRKAVTVCSCFGLLR